MIEPLDDIDSIKEGVGGYGYLTSNSPYHRSTFLKNARVPNVTANVLGYQSYFFDQNKVGPMGAGKRMQQLLSDLKNKGIFRGYLQGSTGIGDLDELVVIRTAWDDSNHSTVSYLKMIFKESGEFWATYKGLNTPSPKFITEIAWKDRVVVDKDFLVRLEGYLLEQLRQWYSIKPGVYNCVEEFAATDLWGKSWRVLPNTEVKVILTYDWWKPSPWVEIKADNKDMVVKDKSYWFLRYKLDLIQKLDKINEKDNE